MSPARGADYLNDDKYLAACLSVLKKKVEAGSGKALLEAIHLCDLLKRPKPEWLRQAGIRVFEAAARFEIKSWDEAFGPPQKKGAHLSVRKDYARLRYPVAIQVALRAPGESIDTGLFEKIGAALGIKKTKASDIYYKHGGKELHEIIKPIVPWLRKKNSGQK
jgi:hypothetical protein